MDSKIKVESPGDVKVTLTMTMKLKDWEALSKQLKAEWPSSDLAYMINSAYTQIAKVIWPENKPNDA